MDRCYTTAPMRFSCAVLMATGAAFLFACAAGETSSTKKKRTPIDPGDEFYGEEVSSEDDGLSPTTNEDSGAFAPAPARPASGGKDAGPVVDGGPTDGGVVVKTYCPTPVAAGDLVVTELMVSSRAGSADDGEWVEIQSKKDCWLKLKGLVVESPRGAAAPNTVTIVEDFELAPKGTFVVADTADPTKNGGIPGKVFAWDTTDVLKNDGDTVTVKMGAATIDTLTYPGFSNLEAGRSIAFPSDCPATASRTDWARWSLTFDEWKPGKKGTPNGANDDVACY